MVIQNDAGEIITHEQLTGEVISHEQLIGAQQMTGTVITEEHMDEESIRQLITNHQQAGRLGRDSSTHHGQVFGTFGGIGRFDMSFPTICGCEWYFHIP